MKGVTAIRLGWGVFALPLSVVSLIAILATWPGVLDNSALRLVLIVYIVGLPLVPALWSAQDGRIVLPVGLAAVAAQIVSFGMLSFWF